MAIARLTQTRVEREKRPGFYADGGNLYLRVAPGGSRQWVFRYARLGRQHDMGLGSLDTFSLDEAREAARECRKLLHAGLDPLAERRQRQGAVRLEAAKTMTFRQCAEAYIADNKDGWKNPKHAAQWPSTMATYVYPVLGDLPVQGVGTTLVDKVVRPIWTEKTETASRVRGRIEAVLDWATVRGYRTGDNPARWRGHLEQLLPKKSKVAAAWRRANGKGEHLAAMDFCELPDFMSRLRQRNSVGARALEFTILTGKRTEEVIGARWREISFCEKLWTIPAGRMKGEREHRVPLSEAALAVLDAMRPGDGEVDPAAFIFPGGKPGRGFSNAAMRKLLQKGMGRAGLTVHGFRSSFRDWAAERTKFAWEVTEMALAHVVSDNVEAAYRRGDSFEKRRQLAQAWAQFCRSGQAAS
jgi:integrase